MELKKHFGIRGFLTCSYLLIFAAYLAFGFLPTRTAVALQGRLQIGRIGLDTVVVSATLDDNGLVTPDEIPATYSRSPNRTLIYGHSSTVFENLYLLNIGDEISYNGKVYVINDVSVLEKDDVNMNKVLAGSGRDSIVLMTCAGELYNNGGASHRLLINAVEK